MTSVEVAPLLPPPPPPPSDAVSPLLLEGEAACPDGDGGPSSTYQWLSSVPLVSSAGSTVYGWYEGSKNCTRVSKYALETVESSVKYVADTAAPVVKKPISAVDSFAVRQLVKLEEKVPSIKTETEEVFEALGERKDAVYTTLTAGKEAITSRLANGKEAISTTLQNGKEAVYNRIQSGSEVLANTRAGCLVGQGVDKTLQLTENAVDYLLPKVEDDKEGGPREREATEMKSMDRVNGEESESESSEEEEMVEEAEGEKEEEEEEEEGEKGEGASRTARVKNLSRKVKLRVYYRTLRQLDSVQQQCKSALEQLKMHIDLLKMAQSAKEGVDRQCKQLQTSLSGMRQHLGSYVTCSSSASPQPEENRMEEESVEVMTPEEKVTLLQGALDYARQLSAKVFTAFQSVSKATSYLPHHLKAGTSQAFSYSQELYTTLKSAKVPTDLPVSSLNRISTVVDTQLNYIKQLGTHIRNSLPARHSRKTPQAPPEGERIFSVPDEAEDSDAELGDPGESPTTHPPGGSQSEGSEEED